MFRRLLAFCLAATLFPASAFAYSYVSTTGCQSGRGAAWPQRLLPSPWQLHEEGYSRLPLDQVQRVMKDSIEIWSQPCCSGFQSEYLGLTSVAPPTTLPINSVGFAEQTWPRFLGNWRNVIAVTLVGTTPRCEILYSQMLFNGVGFRFVDGEPQFQGETDLGAIATHEFGHWLGLGHSNTRSSTMFPTYQGGTMGRTVYDDDRDGVCSLYPWPCDVCTQDKDCPAGHRCREGSCEAVTCTSLEDCPPGTVCTEGVCVPGCRRHIECPDGSRCDEGICIERFDDCRICQNCQSNAECGPEELGYFCTPIGSYAACTKSCQTDEDCPDGTACSPYTEETSICLPEGRSSCTASFRCEGKPLCPHLWESCEPNAMGCGGASDACVLSGEKSQCTCTCRSDADCGDGAICDLDPLSSTRVCWPKELLESCGSKYCRLGQVCLEGACVDACTQTECEHGFSCVHGVCLSVCGQCGEGEFCNVETRQCVQEDPCAGVSCREGRSCRLGSCVDLCEKVRCGEDEVCLEGACVALPSAAPVKDEKGGGCDATAGETAGIIAACLLALAAARRRWAGEGTR